MGSLDLCDPAIEQCQEGDQLVRPSATDLVNLTTVYYANITVLMPTVFVVGINSAVDPDFLEAIVWIFYWFLMTFVHVIVWAIPALTLSFYLLFGVFDDLSLYFVTNGTRNYGWGAHVFFSLFGLLILLSEWNQGKNIEYESAIFFTYTGIAAVLEYFAWTNGVNAARRIDPSWNEHRGKLYPSSFYRRGWVEDEPYYSQTQPDS